MPEAQEQASLPSLAPDGGSDDGDAGASAAPAVALSGKLNANAVTRDELQKIPNINDQVIRVIIAEQPFISISHFRREIGRLVTPDRVATYEKYLFVPVDPNGADTETLRQLPGVDLQTAIQLGRARPFASVDAFLLKLGEMVSPADLEAGRPWVFTW